MAFNFKELVKEQARKVGFFHKDPEDTRGTMPNGGTMGYYPNSKARDLFSTNEIPAEQIRQAEQQAQQNEQAQPWPQQGTGFTPNVGAQQPQQSQPANDPVAQYTSGFTGFQQPVKNMQSWQTQDTTMPPVSQRQQTAYQQPVQQAYQQGTGYQQPVQQAYQQGTGYQQPVQQAYQQGTGYQQPVQQAYQQGTGYQQPVQQAYQQGTGYQQPVQQAYQQGTGYQQPMPQQWQQQPQVQPQQHQYQTPQQRAMGFTPEEENRSQRQSKRQHRAQQPQPVNNIVYMPNTGNTGFMDESGRAYTHMERVVQLVSVSACFRVIEFMRNGESVIVNTENIASETDTQRCLDLLAGAAFTMGSSMTKITQLKRAYLIAPQTVMVMADVAVNNWADRDSARDQFETEAPEHYRPVRGAYVPDRQDEQRRDYYQAQQERMQQEYTGRQRYAQNYR